MKFAKPPIDELVIGVAFKRLDALRLPRLGRFWDRVASEFPKCEHMPPLLHSSEQSLGSEIDGNSSLPGPMLPRIWLVSEDDHSLLQIQADRFIENWRKRRADTAYPGFDVVFGNFVRHWGEYQAWAHAEGLGAIEITEVEMSYVNLFYEGEEWTSASDISGIINWASTPAPYRAGADRLGFFGQYKLPTAGGTLRVSLQQGVRTSTERTQDKQRVFVLNMTATAKAQTWDDQGEDWFQAAHDDLRDFFASSLTVAATERWGARDD